MPAALSRFTRGWDTVESQRCRTPDLLLDLRGSWAFGCIPSRMSAHNLPHARQHILPDCRSLIEYLAFETKTGLTPGSPSPTLHCIVVVYHKTSLYVKSGADSQCEATSWITKERSVLRGMGHHNHSKAWRLSSQLPWPKARGSRQM
jgi:hypothetical protein